MTPGSEPVPSGLQRNPTSVRSPLLNVTRSRAAAAGFCALAGTRSPSAWTINNARTRVLVTTTLRSRYRIYTERSIIVTERGIHVVREHLAKLPPSSSLTIEQRRAQYDRAERVFPTPADVAIEAYQWLLGQGVTPGRVVLAGDSAGGGLTVAALIALRERGLPRPAAGVCISPWVDLACSGASYATKAATDPIVTRDGVAELAHAYLGAGDPKTPLASPLYADLRQLPPLLVQVGSEEVLLDDARGLAGRARAAGVDVTVEEWPAMIHVWHWFLPMLDEAERAIAVIGDFVRARVG